MKKSKGISELGKSLASIGIALVIGVLFILVSGESPIEAYGALLKGALGSPKSIANTISKSIPLAFTGLAVALGSRCGMLNIGAEGQLHAGAMAAVLTSLAFSFLPGPILMAVSILAGVLAGMVVGSIPGFFKAKLNTSEVIVAIMLNYICTLFTSWLVNGPVKAPGSAAQTQVVPESVWFGRLIPQTQLTTAVFLLLIVAAVMYVFLWKTSLGYQLRAVGANSSAAGTAGIPVQKFLVVSIILSGGLAGLAGSYFTGFAFAGVLLSLIVGALTGWVYALFCLKWKAHQSVVGVGINLFGSGITAVLLKAIWHTEGMSGSVNAISSFTVPGFSSSREGTA